MEKKPLTANQQALYSYLKEFIEKQKDAPTLKEMAAAIRAKSLNSIAQYLKILEQKKYITRTKHARRNIELRNYDPFNSIPWDISIPVVSSVGCDNLSVLAMEEYDEFIEVDRKIVEKRGDVIAVRAVGNSMNDADIHHGDYILIELTDQANNGDRVAAIVGDMVTVKRLDKGNGIVILRPESKDPKYKPLILHEEFKIAGKVICAIPGQSGDITEVVPIRNN
jgi:repressor LexA